MAIFVLESSKLGYSHQAVVLSGFGYRKQHALAVLKCRDPDVRMKSLGACMQCDDANPLEELKKEFLVKNTKFSLHENFS